MSIAALSTMLLHEDVVAPPPWQEGVVHPVGCLWADARCDVADLLRLHDACGSHMAQQSCLRLWIALWTGYGHFARNKQKAWQKGHLSSRIPGGQPHDKLSGA